MPRGTCYNCYREVGAREHCSECDYCITCCRCNHVKHFNSKLSFHSPTKSQHRLNTSQRFIAAEIEVSRIRAVRKEVEAVVLKWKGSIVHDGSLPFGGFEINTAPAAGDLYVRQITDICKKLAKAKAEVTAQCGLHVHLDARDYNFYDIRRLVKVYAAIEPALFLMVPPSRRNSRYCARCADVYEEAIKDGKVPHKEVKESIVLGTYGELDSTEHRRHKYPDDLRRARYNALNIHSWFYRGTIECRLLEGTVDPEEIINWGVLWAKVLDYSLHSGDDEVSKLSKAKSIDSLNTIVKDNKKLKDYIITRYNKYKGAR
jgi:hypothetical protein